MVWGYVSLPSSVSSSICSSHSSEVPWGKFFKLDTRMSCLAFACQRSNIKVIPCPSLSREADNCGTPWGKIQYLWHNCLFGRLNQSVVICVEWRHDIVITNSIYTRHRLIFTHEGLVWPHEIFQLLFGFSMQCWSFVRFNNHTLNSTYRHVRCTKIKKYSNLVLSQCEKMHLWLTTWLPNHLKQRHFWIN